MRTVLQMIPLHCQKPINFLIFKHDNRKTKNQKEVQNFLNPVTIAIIAAVAAAVVSESSDLYSARYTVKRWRSLP